VWNVFFVPRFGTMIYTMPGMATRLYLQANQDGVYDGQSSHFSGDGFSGMRFKVQAVPADQFNAWVSSAHSAGKTLDGQAYADLAKQSSYVPPITYSGVAPGLFDAVVNRTAPAPELPHMGHPTADVSPRSNI
jgi:cytochrome o ubiquinol oxidase subunit 2